MRRALLLLGALVWLGACAVKDRQVPLTNAVAMTDTEIQMYVAQGCYESVRVEVDEGPERVTVKAYASDAVGGDCGTNATATLENPLGARELFDAVSGEVLDVTPLAETTSTDP